MSEFVVAIILVILSGVLGIVSTRGWKFSLAGGVSGLFGVLAFSVRLWGLYLGVGSGNAFFGAQSAPNLSVLWFLSIGFWLAIIGSIIMLVASPTKH